MAFVFKRASCVAVGTFNMYIIQPAWLAKVGILPRGIEVAVHSKLDEPGFRYSSPKLPWRWVVSPNLIQIESESEEIDCGDVMAKVFEMLPWTPLVAVGNNAIYHASPRDMDEISIGKSLVGQAPDGFALAQRTVHYGLKHQEALYNLYLGITEDELELALNAHTDLHGHESVDAQEAARQFLQDRQTGRRLIQDVFPGITIHDDPDIP